MTPVVIQYPLDLTGRHPDNLVVGERHGPCGPGNRVFVLNYGPFYAKHLVLRNATTHQELVPDVDYKAVQTFIEPTLQTGKLVCSIIQIQPTAFAIEIDVDYQVLGGDYSLSTSALENLVHDLENDDRPVRWGEIIGKPDAYVPVPHMHDIHDVFGWQYVVAALESVRSAILIGDPSADEDFYAYVDMKFAQAMASIDTVSTGLNSHVLNTNNPHQVTKEQLGLGNVGNYGLATTQIARLNLSNETLITPYLAPYAIEFHTTDHNNPHNVTKAQTGLGNVDNFPTATLAQAIEGADDASFLTPYRARMAFLEWGGGGVPPDPVVPPTANFSIAGAQSVPVGSDPVLTFTNTSAAGSATITTYNWNFGNGTTSAVTNPPAVTYVFPESSRSYTVSLQVTDVNGVSNTRNQTITLQHYAEQVPPQGVEIYVNGASGGYNSQLTTTGAQTSALHTLNFTLGMTAGQTGPFTYSWALDRIYRVDNGQTITGTNWTSTQKNPGNKSATITLGAGNCRQEGSVSVTDQSNGLSTTAYCTNFYKTLPGPYVTAEIGLNSASSNLNSTASTLTAVFDNQSSVAHAPGESFGDFAWTFSATSGTVNPTTFNHTGNPISVSVSIVDPAIGSGSVTANLTMTSAPSSLQDSRSLTVNFTRQPPVLVGPTASFNGSMTYNSGTDTSSVTVTNTSVAGDGLITSNQWSCNWSDGTTSSSSSKNPPAFTASGYGAGLNKSASVNLTVTDANGLSNSTSRNYSVPFTPITRTFVNTSGTETAPLGCSNVKITVVGGGGSGDSTDRWTPDGGDGGGGGGCAISTYAISPGQTLNYVAGSGGIGSGILGVADGDSSQVSSGSKSITTMIGQGGRNGNNLGTGGEAVGGNVANYSGQQGGVGEAWGGLAGGAVIGGEGGMSGLYDHPSPTSIGHGGAGAPGNGDASPGISMKGGPGAAGVVIFEYT